MESLTIQEFIDLVSKSFTLNQRTCRVCEYLPMEKICEVTLDILFERRSLNSMEKQYSQFSTDGKMIWFHRFRNHRDKCCRTKGVFTDDDLRKLGILEDQAIMLQRLYNMQFDDELSTDDMKEEIRRQRIYNLSLFEKQRKVAQEKASLLEQGILPQSMEITFQKKSGAIDFGLLVSQENSVVLGLTKQIDVIQSDIQKNAAMAERAAKNNTTVIQIMSSSLVDMESKFKNMLRAVKASLDILLPTQPEIVKQVMRTLVNCMNSDVVPIIEKTKETLQIESK